MDIKDFNNQLLEIAQRLKNEQFRKPCLNNEQATKQWLIVPTLMALGWDVFSPDVHPEDEGGVSGKADYGLRIDGKVRIFVEAKALGKTLNDKDAEQTSNYANNKGVAWCVLTNGRIWRIYKSSGAALAKRLLIEVEIEEDPDKIEAATQHLSFLSRDKVQSGELDSYATKVFIDNRLRDVLKQLFDNPSQKFINILKDELEGFTSTQIKDALKRLNPQECIESTPSLTSPTIDDTSPPKNNDADTSTSPTDIQKTSYTEDDHLQGKPQNIVHLLHELQSLILQIASPHDLKPIYKKRTIGFKLKNYFADIEVQNGKLKLDLALDPSIINPLPENARNMLGIGHWGNGDLRFTILSSEDISAAKPYIEQAFQETHPNT